MRVLIVVQGHYGERIAENIKAHRPAGWEVFVQALPPGLPGIIDDADEFLPENLPAADLLVFLGESPGAAQLIPDIAEKIESKAVIAPADDRAWLPPGLARQIERKLESKAVDMVYPVPFCTLTEKDSRNPYIRQFARHFGRPEVKVEFDQDHISRVTVVKEAPCGSTRYVADGMAGVWERDAVEKAGLLHHQYPCLATMVMDQEFGDTLMHRGGLMVKLEVEKAMKDARAPKQEGS